MRPLLLSVFLLIIMLVSSIASSSSKPDQARADVRLLVEAVGQSESSRVISLVEKGVSANERYLGVPVAFFAVDEKCNPEILKIFISHGLDFTLREPYRGASIVHFASQSEDIRCLRFLRDYTSFEVVERSWATRVVVVIYVFRWKIDCSHTKPPFLCSPL